MATVSKIRNANEISSMEELVERLHSQERDLLDQRQHLESQNHSLSNDRTSSEAESMQHRDATQERVNRRASIRRDLDSIKATLEEIESGTFEGPCTQCYENEVPLRVVATMLITKCVSCREKNEEKSRR